MFKIISYQEYFTRDVNIMCNLSQGIKEDGIAEGEARMKDIACPAVTQSETYKTLI